MTRFTRSILLILFNVGCASQQPPLQPLSPNAPPDHGVLLKTPSDRDAAYQDLTLCIEAARKSLPDAASRFREGLPPHHVFFVTVRLRDSDGHEEQVFVAVNRYRNGVVEGRLANQLQLVHGYTSGQELRLPESEVLDWTISRPDGSEEGNFIGKHIDTGEPCGSTTGGHA